MRYETINGHTVEIYDSIGQLPLDRYIAYNHALLLDANLGSDLEDYTRHTARLASYIKDSKTDAALQTLENQDRLLRLLVAKTNPKMNAFCCLVKSIDNKPNEDFSEAGCRRLIAQLSTIRLSWAYLVEILDSIKKKVDAEVETLFHELSPSAGAIRYAHALKRRAKMLVDGILSDQAGEALERVKAVDSQLLDLVKPVGMSGAQGAEVQYLKSSHAAALMVGRYTGRDATQMSVLDFMTALVEMQKAAKQNNQQNKRR